MKTTKSCFAVLMVVTLLLAACQPQATAPAAPATDAPASTSAPEAASPEATNPPVATTAPVQSAALFAKLSELAGLVEIRPTGQGDFVTASVDMQLEVNGQIQTGADGRVRLDLSSGTIIRVAPASLFTLTVNEEVEGGLLTKIKMELGKVFIILNGGSAEVETPSGVASVQGSYLKVEFDPVTGKLTLTCLEGNCSVNSPDGRKIDFTNGQKIVIFRDANGNWVLEEGPMSPEDFQEWLDNNPEAQELVEQAVGGGPGSGGGGACLSLIEPASESRLDAQGRVKFAWGSQSGAAKYVIKFTTASGNVIAFETSGTEFDPYIEGFLPQEGSVNWSVTALDSSGNEICTSEPFSFSKPDSDFDKPKKEDEEPFTPTCYYCNSY